jgi:prepilin-type processing-associated H-X9-DG protein
VNAYNPIGNSVANIAALDQHYTASVGFGPDGTGEYIRNHKLTSPRCSEFITASDGVYMGRQSVTRIGDTNSRIGYRHPGIGRQDGMANVAFADGHVEPIVGNKFPRSISSSDSPALLLEKKGENLSGPTVYSDAKLVFRGI